MWIYMYMYYIHLVCYR
uniref:Uncharacterized protein n=1 Tax=Arundo donax TaxID=35708 RepID=A0A0A8XQF1_ARUDO